MTKLSIEVPDNLYSFLKNSSNDEGKSLKDLVVKAVGFFLNQESKKKRLKDLDFDSFLIENFTSPKKTTKKIIQKKLINNDKITESEADKLLKPYILKLTKDIKNKNEHLISSKEFFAELKKINGKN